MEAAELESIFGRLLRFLTELEEINIHYSLKHVRDSIMVVAHIPEGYWEIEFFEDGTIEVELFGRDGGVSRPPIEWLDQFLARNRD